MYQLTIASRSKYSSKSIAYKIVAISVPTIFLIVSYYIFVEGKNLDTSNPIKLFLDLGYPFGQSIYISLALSALILSSRFLGGVLNRSASIILCGLITQYVADFMFLYQASRGTWQVSNVNDLIYLIAYFLISLGIASFYLTFGEIGKPAE